MHITQSVFQAKVTKGYFWPNFSFTFFCVPLIYPRIQFLDFQNAFWIC